MYQFIGFLIMIITITALVSFLFCRYRKSKICKILCEMSHEEKCDALNPLIEPFGYCYEPSQDIFSTTVNAPQRAFGYTALFDDYAPHFNMVFDCLPIYFDYDDRTWLIEFWKGQYNINLGCEVGIYQSDSLVASISQKTALFHCVDDNEMLPLSIRLFHRGLELSHLYKKHWWLTAFHMGLYCEPGDLSVQIGITFPNSEMLAAFANALEEQSNIQFYTCGLQVQLLFNTCSSCRLSFLKKLICRFSQWKNRIMCRLFLWITKPFYSSLDRLLYLYYYLPPLFRRIFRNKKRGKCIRKSNYKSKNFRNGKKK